MVLSPSIDLEAKDYRGLAYYDRFYPPPRVEEHVQIGQTLAGSTSSLLGYTKALVDLFGFHETSSLSTAPVDLIIAKPTDKDLWLSLIGIFASGDPHFAERHDEIYGQRV
ncbi:MAG: hypothetical protein ACREQA_15850 [Candidatus Binatia bacterium]